MSPIYSNTTSIAIVFATSWETFNVMVVRVDLYVTLLLQTFGANKDISPNNESVFCEVDLSQCAKKLKNSGRNYFPNRQGEALQSFAIGNVSKYILSLRQILLFPFSINWIFL